MIEFSLKLPLVIARCPAVLNALGKHFVAFEIA